MNNFALLFFFLLFGFFGFYGFFCFVKKAFLNIKKFKIQSRKNE